MNFLTDAQASDKFVQLWRAVGAARDFAVVTVYEEGIDREPADERLVAWARMKGNFVFLTFDTLRGTTGAAVAREIRARGGKVLVVMGGPQQSPERAVGRLLFHWDEWYPFFEKQDGRVDISDTKHSAKLLPRSRLTAAAERLEVDQFDSYLQQRQEASRRPRRRRQRRSGPPNDQFELDLPDAT